MLNSAQKAAVTYIDGPLLVLAGAGSGKTRVITEKIVFLIRECQYPVKSIYAVTFTNKAAQEMMSRASKLLASQERRGLNISTFHTLGLKIIKKELAHCGLRAGFSLFDTEDSAQLLRSYLSSSKASDKAWVKQLQKYISQWKNALLSPDAVARLTLQNAAAVEAQALYLRYQTALTAFNAVDFDDLLAIPVNLLTQHEEIRSRWQNSIRHLLIDEYQDSNESQYRLMKLLTGVREGFTVVGDDDQSIYTWRGAKPENLMQLQIDYPRLKLIKLEQNYRSTNRILGAANTLIQHNTHIFEKKLWSNLGVGDALRILVCKDEPDEAEQVITDILSHKIRAGKRFHEYAILYRGNHQARVFEKVLRHYSIPYHISGGQSWFARSEVKDMFAYLKLLCNEMDDAAFLRAVNIPKRGIGENSLAALGQYAKKRGCSLFQGADHLALSTCIAEKPRLALLHFKEWITKIKHRLTAEPVQAVLAHLVETSGYENHIYDQHTVPAKAQKCMDNIWELMQWIQRLLEKTPGTTLDNCINKLILMDILEKNEENECDRVQLLTLHAAKGLEFPFVYLVGMEEGILPHYESIEEERIEEERRLVYVGLTRAQQGLVLSLVRQRRRGGELQECQPSRFLEELPQESLEWFGRPGQKNTGSSQALAQSHLSGLKKLLA